MDSINPSNKIKTWISVDLIKKTYVIDKLLNKK